MKVLVLHGPNLNLLGVREPDQYGVETLSQVDESLRAIGQRAGVEVTCRQSNHEGELIDWIQQARGRYEVIILNPGGYTHTSVALRDAVIASDVDCYEVHITNTAAREPFRHKSLFADISRGSILGFGTEGYRLALTGAMSLRSSAS